jgi:DNA primase
MKSIQIEEQSKLFEDVVSSCQYILKNDAIAASAREYLDSRIPKSFQDKFKFGYFPANDQLSFISSLVDKDVLKKLGLIYPKYLSGGVTHNGHFTHHNLIFPFSDMYGNIIALVGRTLFDKQKQDALEIPKYKYSYGLNKELYLFGLDSSRQSIIEKDYVILVEGQFDYYSCKCAGIDNVVALGGAALSRYQFFKLRRYTNNFVLLLDSDESGRRASKNIKRNFGDYARIIISQPPSEFKDIDDFLIKEADISRRNHFINNLNNLKL